MSNVTIRVHARGTGSYIITSPDGLTNLIEVTPTGVNILGSPYAPGGGGVVNPPAANNNVDLGTNALRFKTLYLGTSLISPTVGPSAGAQHFLPNVASDTVALQAATQLFSNKSLYGTTNRALASGSNSDVEETFSFESVGNNGPGLAGIGVRSPFRVNNQMSTPVTIGGVQAAAISTMPGQERGYTALCGGYAGTAYPTVRAVVPPTAAAYTNGLEVMGAIMGANPALLPFGLGANLGLDFMSVGDGVHRFYGATEFNVTDDGTPQGGLSLNMNATHRLTVAPAAVGMGAMQFYSIVDSLGVSSDLGAVIAQVMDATPGSVQGGLGLFPADGMNGAGMGLLVAPMGAAAARVRGVHLAPGATGVNAKLRGFGEDAAGIDLIADPQLGGGSIRIRDQGDTATILGVEPFGTAPASLVLQTGVALAPYMAPPTIDAVNGQASIQALTSSTVVNNAHVTTASVIHCTLQFVDGTATQIVAVVPGAGFFTVVANANATADTQFGFTVFNPAN